MMLLLSRWPLAFETRLGELSRAGKSAGRRPGRYCLDSQHGLSQHGIRPANTQKARWQFKWIEKCTQYRQPSMLETRAERVWTKKAMVVVVVAPNLGGVWPRPPKVQGIAHARRRHGRGKKNKRHMGRLGGFKEQESTRFPYHVLRYVNTVA